MPSARWSVRTSLRSRSRRPPRWPGVAAGLLGVWLLAAAPAAGGVADQVGATFGLVLQEVVQAFPPVEGLVVAVEGDRIYLDLAERDGVRPGQEFTIFRKGEV